MYFCPCPCNGPIDPDTEENTFLALPRNLSYVQESYLDKHSVSSRFVHNPKAERKERRQSSPSSSSYYLDDYGGDDDDDLNGFEVRGDLDGLDIVKAVRTNEFNAFCSSPPPPPSSFSSSSETETHVQPSLSLRKSSLPLPITTSPQHTGLKPDKPPGNEASLKSSPGTGSFISRVAAASRLASFLSPPKDDPCPRDYDKDFSSSVDLQPLPQQPTATLPSPDTEPRSTSVKDESPQRGTESQPGLGLSMDQVEDNQGSDPTQVENSTLPSVNPLTASSPIDTSPVQEGDHFDSQEDIPFRLEDFQGVSPSSDTHLDTKYSSCLQQSGIPNEGRLTEPRRPPQLTLSCDGKVSEGQGHTRHHESPDSDAFSEEGVFVNMVDGLDTHDKSTTLSEVSDDTCVSADSMFLSPDEGELEDDDGEGEGVSTEDVPQSSSGQPRMSMEEAISRAASDLSKMSMLMYPGVLGSPSAGDDEGDNKSGNARTGRKLFRTSPLRQSEGLTIHLSHENLSSRSQHTDHLDAPESPVYEDDEFNFNRKSLRKSSSLKTNKTPPGTPHRKKVVRFADAMGLDLESVRHVLNMESPPRIPPSAMADLKQGLGAERKDVGLKFLCPCFTQPGAKDGFMTRVLSENVCLENAIITDLTITGFVRVANVAYHKSVRVRYTHNKWTTFHDIAASYVLNSCDGRTDRFSFSIVAPAYFVAGNRLEFAVSFNAEGTEYWDSNGGQNYAFECFAKDVPTDNESAWMHFL